jgi:hypothetical protein
MPTRKDEKLWLIGIVVLEKKKRNYLSLAAVFCPRAWLIWVKNVHFKSNLEFLIIYCCKLFSMLL